MKNSATKHNLGSILTICMVMLPKHEPYVKANIRLIKRKNYAQDLKLILIRNTSDVCTSGFTQLDDDIIDIQYLNGYRQNVLSETDGLASYQHGMAINLGLQHIHTRYLLVLDPDFYILRDNWAEAVLSHMKTKKLSFFGAPWHPKWYNKWRDFPCAHCLFIDLNRVQPIHLDFLPHFQKTAIDQPSKTTASLHHRCEILYSNVALQIKERLEHPGLLPFFARGVYYFTIHCKNIGKSKDTGYWLKHQFGGSSTYKNEQLTPVIDETQDFPHIPHMQSSIGKLIEHLIPSRISYLPTIQYQDKSHPDYLNKESKTWERFIWKNRIFGVHKRLSMMGS